ncbi:hypothetical protein LSH36_701g00046 [Paralvinella palmiformis]|uniref:Heme transporter hrg1-A n=1 Tax=Paralvinella palmiformis TaxID=53620 RepID=A0AAD9MW20_9ANNE|nr:hypothetical protein LSH36_701g00046 [Paralvinella palmiformis]
MSDEGCCNVKVRIILSAIGVIVGLSVFLVFGIVYENLSCAIWALISGVFASLTLCTHVKYARDQWRTHTEYLKPMMFTGCFGQLAGVCGFVAYITLASVLSQGLLVRGPGYYLTSIWCFITWKWGFLLFYSSRYYRRCYHDNTGLPSDVPYEKV